MDQKLADVAWKNDRMDENGNTKDRTPRARDVGRLDGHRAFILK